MNRARIISLLEQHYDVAEHKNGDGLAYCPDCQENNEMGETYGY